MIKEVHEIAGKGKQIRVPSLTISNRTVVVTGRWLKTAYVHDEMLTEGEVVEDPECFITTTKKAKLGADIFTFAQKQTEGAPKHPYYFEWDNAAIIPITSVTDWEKRIEPDVRKAVKKAGRLGVTIQPVLFDDAFVRGIMEIYNECPVRQGRPFWHYGKDFATVKRENSTFLQRSDFLGAYFDGELIGFLKLVHVDKIAIVLQNLSKTKYSSKKPTNVLIKSAVEICERKGVNYLDYGKYAYGNKHDSLTEFKRRNGFKEFRYPRYYVPLTAKGRLALKLRLHRGFKELVPERLGEYLRRLRSYYYQANVRKTTQQSVEGSERPGRESSSTGI